MTFKGFRRALVDCVRRKSQPELWLRYLTTSLSYCSDHVVFGLKSRSRVPKTRVECINAKNMLFIIVNRPTKMKRKKHVDATKAVCHYIKTVIRGYRTAVNSRKLISFGMNTSKKERNKLCDGMD